MASGSRSNDGAGSSSSAGHPGIRVSNVSPVLLDEHRDAAVGVSVGLHPLPIISMSEHLTRTIVQSGKSNSRVYGALLGTQAGRTIEIQTTFELLMTEDKVDHGLLRDRQSQFKQVFPTFDILGWYSNGPIPTQSDMDVHRQLTEYNESPLFLQISPSADDLAKAKTSGELPIAVYETFVDVQNTATSGQAAGAEPTGPAMYFRPAQYQVQTGEAERIAVDHASKPADSDGTGQSSLIANLTTQYNAIKMLSDRIQMLVKYTDDVRAGTVPRDHESLRQIASLVARLPASGDIAEFRQEFLTEHNDLLLTIYLSDMTNGVHGLNELMDKFDMAQQSNEDAFGAGGQAQLRAFRRGAGGSTSAGGKVARGARAAKADAGMLLA